MSFTYLLQELGIFAPFDKIDPNLLTSSFISQLYSRMREKTRASRKYYIYLLKIDNIIHRPSGH